MFSTPSSGASEASSASRTTPCSLSSGNGRIKVAVRVRPFTAAEEAEGKKCIIAMDGTATKILNPDHFYDGGELGVDYYTRRFDFDHSFRSHSPAEGPDSSRHRFEQVRSFWSKLTPTNTGHATQETVFSSLGEFLLSNVLSGYNCSLLAYGQTGSGKTYTMFGCGEEDGEEGVVPRLCRALFERVERESEKAEAAMKRESLPCLVFAIAVFSTIRSFSFRFIQLKVLL